MYEHLRGFMTLMNRFRVMRHTADMGSEMETVYRICTGKQEADISGDEGIVMKQVDEGAVESDTSGTSSYSNNTK